MTKPSVNKCELVQQLAQQCGLHLNEADKIVTTFIHIMGEALCQHGQVRLTGLGKIERYAAKASMRRNPKTGEPVPTPAQLRFRFKASPQFLCRASLRH